jgi:hypothetical protein
MHKYMLIHHHRETACRSLLEAWEKAGGPVDAGPSGCAEGDHTIWWVVRASDRNEALAKLPPPVAEHTTPLLVA